MSESPVQRPADWLTWVNEPQTANELAELRESGAAWPPLRRAGLAGGNCGETQASEHFPAPTQAEEEGRAGERQDNDELKRCASVPPLL